MKTKFQERMNARGRAHIAGLAATYRKVWQSTCQHDGIDENAKFVVFSDDNPFVQFINAAMRELCEAQAEYAAGGYVGLRIGERS